MAWGSGGVRFWNVSDGKLTLRALEMPGIVESAALDPDQNVAVTVSQSGLKHWSIPKGAVTIDRDETDRSQNQSVSPGVLFSKETGTFLSWSGRRIWAPDKWIDADIQPGWSLNGAASDEAGAVIAGWGTYDDGRVNGVPDHRLRLWGAADRLPKSPLFAGLDVRTSLAGK
jgi:hypothetical protein